ncbi:peptidylprolyl isomerase [Sphaerisporangium krabiense]|uniref:Peptidyl-prolyl cis-trans isomerase n=1 Tax=Sphaerisporangium krabiense TaxID=763782 RepID=A0A7W9DTZ7_9ACTN|nr:FKBP-type peptidyl-prolyl cis-trans isomerase [Sphaerisporangium krabiense]MBB5631161.1 peptidylprolyl isomerase [Sphaerisporangium krabiense]GII61227.1 peptidylprolyl isomerase [Sphaerisporangium krabiense]
MRRLALLAALPLLFAAACGTEGDVTAKTEGAAPADVKVTGEVGKKPQVAFPSGKPPATSSSKTITPGQGAQLKEGDSVVANLTAYNWDGKANAMSGSTYDEGAPQLIKVDSKLPTVVHKAFQANKVGGRFLAVVAKDSLTREQMEQAKSQGADTSIASVYVVDVLGVPTVKAAQGDAKDADVKGVKLENPGGEQAPKLTTKTDESAPKKLVSKTVIKGGGPEVKAGQNLLVQYTGKIWGTDTEFDSSWSRGEPVMFQIGTGKVIKGWDQGLVGVPVGSRVLLAIPPDLGYGKNGQGDKIKGTDTLVFVVDVLGAY